MEELTLTEVVVLAALADHPRYGYELVARIDEVTSGGVRMRPGNLYRVLHRLAQRELVRELEGQPSPDERRRYFRATARGQRMASRQLAMYAGVLKRVPILRESLADG